MLSVYFVFFQECRLSVYFVFSGVGCLFTNSTVCFQEYVVPEEDQIYVLPGDVLGMHFDDSGNRSFVYQDYVGMSTPMYNCNPCTRMRKCVCVCVCVCVNVCVNVCVLHGGACVSVYPYAVCVCVCVHVCLSVNV